MAAKCDFHMKMEMLGSEAEHMQVEEVTGTLAYWKQWFTFEWTSQYMTF